MDDRVRALDVAYRRASDFLEGVRERKVWPAASYDEMVARMGGELPVTGADAADVVEELATLAEPGLMATQGGRFFGFVIGSSLPAAMGADWLTTAWDQNVGLAVASPAGAAADEISGRWLVDLLGLPAGSEVGLVTGATMASFACLAVARREVLARHGWDLDTEGAFGAPPVRLAVGEFRHGAIDRAARFLGFGTDQLVVIPADEQGRIKVNELSDALDRLEPGPTIVCLQAGEVNTGDFDDFPAAIEVARARQAWIHVDGAFGLWAAASTRYRHLTAGVEAADSWATDAHKTLNVPYDTGIAIVKDAEAMHAVFAPSGAAYIIAGAGDPSDRTPEFSRRARGFPVWAALRSLGRDGVYELVDQLAAHASRFADGLRRMPGIEVVNDVVFTQVMAACATDDATRQLGVDLRAEGTAVLTPSRWGGRAVQRCSMSSWATTADDVDRTLEAIRRLLPAP
jgi:glutamate/tyrosine decarboxylase-like PLP-dependent enzyme